MDLNQTAENIRKIYSILSGKSDVEVSILYKSKMYGVTKPWLVRIDNRETSAVSLEQALAELFVALKQELAAKAIDSENQAKAYRQALSNLEN